MASGLKNNEPYVFEKQEHRHAGWFCCPDSLHRLADRIQRSECANVGYHFADDPPAFTSAPIYRLYCLTHKVPADYGHLQDVQRGNYAREDPAQVG
jgi:hypothetical protein